MAEPANSVTPEELALELRRHGALVSSTLRGIASEVLVRSSSRSGWGAHELLAHIASIEWTYPRLIEVAQAAGVAGADDVSGAAGAVGAQPREFRDSNDGYNDRQVGRRGAQAASELIAEFEQNRATLVEAVSTVSPRLLDVEIQSAGGATGSFAEVLRSVAITHVDGHLDAIVRAAGRSGGR